MMDGRVKTLHPAIHAGLLARRSNARDMEELAGQGYGLIDLVAVNLYPFQETVARDDVTVGLGHGERGHWRAHDDPGGGQEPW